MGQSLDEFASAEADGEEEEGEAEEVLDFLQV